MTAIEKLYFLLREFHIGNYRTTDFADQFELVYIREVDYEDLTEREHLLFKELSDICGRFSPYEEDLKTGAFYNEEDIRKKAEEVYVQLCNI